MIVLRRLTKNLIPVHPCITALDVIINSENHQTGLGTSVKIKKKLLVLSQKNVNGGLYKKALLDAGMTSIYAVMGRLALMRVTAPVIIGLGPGELPLSANGCNQNDDNTKSDPNHYCKTSNRGPICHDMNYCSCIKDTDCKKGYSCTSPPQGKSDIKYCTK